MSSLMSFACPIGALFDAPDELYSVLHLARVRQGLPISHSKARNPPHGPRHRRIPLCRRQRKRLGRFPHLQVLAEMILPLAYASSYSSRAGDDHLRARAVPHGARPCYCGQRALGTNTLRVAPRSRTALRPCHSGRNASDILPGCPGPTQCRLLVIPFARSSRRHRPQDTGTRTRPAGERRIRSALFPKPTNGAHPRPTRVFIRSKLTDMLPQSMSSAWRFRQSRTGSAQMPGQPRRSPGASDVSLSRVHELRQCSSQVDGALVLERTFGPPAGHHPPGQPVHAQAKVCRARRWTCRPDRRGTDLAEVIAFVSNRGSCGSRRTPFLDRVIPAPAGGRSCPSRSPHVLPCPRAMAGSAAERYVRAICRFNMGWRCASLRA